MNIYISHSNSYDYMNQLYKPLMSCNLNKNNNFFLPHLKENQMINTKSIIANYDLLIADVSIPSTGQGIELGWADLNKIPILCIYKSGAKISSSLRFITSNFIEYNNIDDMINKITNFVNNII